MINFPARIPDCDSHSPAVLDLFFSSDASIFSAMAFPPLGDSDQVFISVSINFSSNSQRDATFHRIPYDYSRANWDGLCDHLRDGPLEDIFKLGASAAASTFCEYVQVGIDVYIPHRKYQVNPHSSTWFSAACAASIIHRNHFFRLYQRDKSSDSKVKFRQASNRCRRFLKLPKLHMRIKQKDPLLPKNLALVTKINLPSPLFNGLEVSSASDKAKFLLNTFIRTIILMTQVSLYLFSLLDLIRNCIIFL